MDRVILKNIITSGEAAQQTLKKNVYGETNPTQTFSVIKFHKTIEEAMKYKIYLEALNDRKNQTYFLASDTETVMNKVITAHNKSVNMKEVA